MGNVQDGMLSHPERNGRILLVDDDKIFADSVKRVLSTEYEVNTIHHPETVVREVLDHHYDLIMLDNCMQPITGLELVRQLRAQRIESAIILMTAHTTFELAAEAVAEDIDGFLSKPVNYDLLRKTVQDHLLRNETKVQLHSIERQILRLTELNRRIHFNLRQFESIFESITDPVMVFDLDMNLLAANQATRRAFGLTDVAVVGMQYKTLLGVCDPRDCPPLQARDRRQPTQGKWYHGLTDRWFHLFAYPVFEEDGTLKNIVQFCRDITQVTASEEKFVKAVKTAGQANLASEVGHELRNLLTIVSCRAELLSKDLVDGKTKDLARHVEGIRHGIRQMVKFSDDLMSVKQPTRAPRRVELVSLIQGLLTMIDSHTTYANVDFVRHFDCLDAFILAEEIEIQQIMLNLLKNAAEAMDAGTILIRVSKEDSFVHLTIADSGEGMPAGILTHLFAEQVSTKSSGHGLGMLVVKKLVEANHGTITVTSMPGEGTTFILRFPYQDVQESHLNDVANECIEKYGDDYGNNA